MNRSSNRYLNSGFTRIELISIFVVLIVIAFSLILPSLSRSRHGYSKIKDTNNLKNVGLAFRIFANDHNEKFPQAISGDENQKGTLEYADQAKDIWRHFSVMSNELSTPKILISAVKDVTPRIEATNL